MQDRYLFRAKRIDNGEWVKGYYTYYPCGFTSEDKMEHAIRDTVTSGDCNKLYFVDPSTICQCTGLKDKNGKLIWENDIVRNEKGDIGVVQWFEEHAAFMIWNKTKHYVCYLAENDFSKIEIAGNEFDNAELLEV